VLLGAAVPPTCGPRSTEGLDGGFDQSTAVTSETAYDAWQAEIDRAWANYVEQAHCCALRGGEPCIAPQRASAATARDTATTAGCNRPSGQISKAQLVVKLVRLVVMSA